MNFSLIICTYCRAVSLLRLLNSLQQQTLYPSEIVIVDGSHDDETRSMVKMNNFKHLIYLKVADNNRGLTKQRNVGIENADPRSEIICFLDDDILLKPLYFEKLIQTFSLFPESIGVGGSILSEGVWRENNSEVSPKFENYYYKTWERYLGKRNVLRKKLNLLSDKPPGIMPTYSNGFSIGFYPPNGEIHPVEYFMGGVSAYKKELFDKIKFSEYYEGYGLYEDMDFCLRASKVGPLYLNTSAQVYHLHENGGRPDHFKYGKMVVENGWVVWKLKYPNTEIKAILKWNSIVLLLLIIRIKNSLVDKEKGAMNDAMGRLFSWIRLGIIKPDYFKVK